MTIYVLIDPRTKQIRYIGKADDVRRRYMAHIRPSQMKTGRLSCRWIRSLVVRGLKPTLMVLEECDGNGCAEEIYHIALARRDGCKLTNRTDGGEGAIGFRHSPESRALMSRQRKGIKLSPERRAAVVAASLFKPGFRPPAEWIQSRVEKQRGREMHPNSRAALIAANSKRTRNPELFRPRVSNGLLGKKLTEETKAKIAASKLGKPLSLEHRMKLSARVYSEKTRAKMSAAKKGKPQTAFHVAKLTEARAVGTRFKGWDLANHPKVMRDLRVQKSLSIRQLAELVGRCTTQIGHVERGKFYPSKKTGAALEAALGPIVTSTRLP